MAYSAYSSGLFLKHAFTADAVARPTSWTAHLYDGDPEDTGAEFTDSGYSSQAVSFTVGDADSNNRSEAVSDVSVSFPAIVDGTVTAAYLVIKDESGNVLAQMAFSPARVLGVGNILSLPAGGIVLKGE